MLLFGTAGIPLSTIPPTTEKGIERVKHLGLDAMELEFVRGVNLSEEKALVVKKIAQSHGIVLSAHAPYYINLNSKDPEKIKASIRRIVESALVLEKCGGKNVVFHPGYYSGASKKDAYIKIKESINEIIHLLHERKCKVVLRPESMGRTSQFGTLEEIISLSKELSPYVLPTIDFAHLHARSRGGIKKAEDIEKILKVIEEELGKEALNNMHIHISGIEYGEKGEKKHLNLAESDFPYKSFIEVLTRYNVHGTIISESPNIEEDALMLKKIYEEIKP